LSLSSSSESTDSEFGIDPEFGIVSEPGLGLEFDLLQESEGESSISIKLASITGHDPRIESRETFVNPGLLIL
jgi:hypothetical protein